MPRRKLDIATLRRLLAQQERELAQLADQRGRLLAQLQQVDRRIAALGGGEDVAPARRGPGRPPKVVATAVPLRTRGGRITLRSAIAQVLSQADRAMSANEIDERLSSTGYRSTSKHVGNMLRQILYKSPEFRRVRRGTYALNKPRGRRPKAK